MPLKSSYMVKYHHICISQVIKADEANKKLILSEKEAVWVKYSRKVSVGDIFDARVGSIEDYGAFLHLRFPDGTFSLLISFSLYDYVPN